MRQYSESFAHQQPSKSSSLTQANTSKLSALIPIYQHLHQVYPCMPKYLNDPQQSQIIRTYAILLNRYTGLYGSQPKYYIRSPASICMLGSPHKSVGFGMLTTCAMQNFIISINTNNGEFIRVNHYQSAVYGQKIIKSQGHTLKYNTQTQYTDQYSTLLISCLKVYANMIPAHNNTNTTNNNSNILPGMDILLYDDFIQDQHMGWRQALCLGLITAVHYAINSKNIHRNQLNHAFYNKFAHKLSTTLNIDRFCLFSLGSQYGKMDIIDNCTVNNTKYENKTNNKQTSNTKIKFPEDIDIIIAHSMTPLPKKMIAGKRQNLRACQIQLGIQIIKSQLGATNSLSSLQQLKQYLNCTNYQQLLQTVQQHIPKHQLTVQQIQSLTSQSMIQLLKSVPFANAVIDGNVTYHPYQRIKYYIQEIITIQHIIHHSNSTKGELKNNQNEKSIQTQTGASKQVDIVQAIQQSYNNSKQLLGIGSQQFDQMIKIIQQSALAYKIIGDGWGGNLLILCHKNQSQNIVDKLINQFYLSAENRVLLSDDVEQYVRIVGQPGTGLCVLNPQSQIWFC